MAQVCRRLDGIPLAIELAAARVRRAAGRADRRAAGRPLPAADRRQPHGAAAPADAARRRSTGATTCSTEPERALFAAAGGVRRRLDAGGGRGGLRRRRHRRPTDVLDLLAQLVDKSLVVAEERGSAAWYRLLHPVRAYALEKLHLSGDELNVQSRHLDWYVHLAERFASDWRGPRQRIWFDTIEREEGNIRAALRGCLDRGDITEGLRLPGALYRYWDLHNRSTEGREWLAELLCAVRQSGPDAVTARALVAAGRLATYHGDTRQAEAQLSEALRLWRGLGERTGIAHTLIALGGNAQAQDKSARADALWSEGLAVARGAGDVIDTYWALHALGRQAAGQGDYARAQALHEEGLLLKRQQDDAFGVACSLSGLAQVEWFRDNYDRARSKLCESLPVLHALGMWGKMALDLRVLAHVTADCGESERSACLFGAADALQERVGDRRSAPAVLNAHPALMEASLAACRARLTPAHSRWHGPSATP